MGTGTACLYACAPFTLIASILLFMMSVMLNNGNWTFAVLAAKHDWDSAAKARCCRNGGVIYICISIVLWILVFIDAFLIELAKLPTSAGKWWRQRRLPSLRELLRNRRKAAEAERPATDVTISAAAANAAAPTPLPQMMTADTGMSRGEAGRRPDDAPLPAQKTGAAGMSAGVGLAGAGAGAPLSSPGRGYENAPLSAAAAARPHAPAVVSGSTSAATSVIEADQLLS